MNELPVRSDKIHKIYSSWNIKHCMDRSVTLSLSSHLTLKCTNVLYNWKSQLSSLKKTHESVPRQISHQLQYRQNKKVDETFESDFTHDVKQRL